MLDEAMDATSVGGNDDEADLDAFLADDDEEEAEVPDDRGWNWDPTIGDDSNDDEC